MIRQCICAHPRMATHDEGVFGAGSMIMNCCSDLTIDTICICAAGNDAKEDRSTQEQYTSSPQKGGLQA